MQGRHQRIRQLLIAPSCPTCRLLCSADRLPCQFCRSQYNFELTCISGNKPLPWRALGLYEGSFRQLILRLKQPRPQQRGLPAFMALFCKQLALHPDVHLVPIPSWKRRVAHRNPLLELSCNARCGIFWSGRERASVSITWIESYGRRTCSRPSKFWNSLRVKRFGWSTTFSRRGRRQSLRTRLRSIEAIYVSGLLCLGRTPLNRR